MKRGHCLAACVCMCLALGFLAHADVARYSRGVHPEVMDQYATDQPMFVCRDGRRSIPRSRLNDDFCDCEDGSDEPGTAACPHGRFYCKNAGHEGKEVFASRVNDGICDCCDGSDEWISGVCKDTCWEEGEEDRRKLREEVTLHQDGSAKHTEMRVQYQLFVKETNEKIAAKEKEIEELKTKVEVAKKEEEVKKEVRMAEVTALLKMKEEEDEKKKKEEEEKKEGEEESAAKTEEAVDEKKEEEKPVVNVDEQTILALQEDLKEVEAETEVLGTVEKEVKEKEPSLEDGEETDALKEYKAAKDALTQAENEKSAAETELNKLKTDIGRDYGKDGLLFHLKNKCIQKTSGGYNYEVCGFEKAKQSHTSLGNFNAVEDDVMKFTGGQTCWNGPARSANVKMVCGKEVEILSVDEPSTCVYDMVMTTPAMCSAAHALLKMEELDRVSMGRQ